MVRNARTSILALVLLASVTAPAGAARAADPVPAASGAPIDCTTASAQMTAMMHVQPAAMPATQNVDKTFATSMQMMLEHGHAMAAIEMQCGKDPATRAEAQRLYDMTAKYTQEAIDINHHL